MADVCPFVRIGFGFKLLVGLVQGDLSRVNWEPDTYHHILGLEITAAVFVHGRVMLPTLWVCRTCGHFWLPFVGVVPHRCFVGSLNDDSRFV